MKIFSSLLLTFTLLSPLPAVAASTSTPSPPQVTAHAYLLQDFNSNQVIMEKNVDERVEPASLTKLMTAYLVFQKLQIGKIQLTDLVRISETAWRMPGSRMYLDLDSHVSVEMLLKGMIIQSGNDASVALAEFIGGTEDAFATLMNEQAQQLGLKNTHYMNSTGLPNEQHYSTARDLALMAQALIHDFPDYYRWYSEREFTYNDITQTNRNLLLWRDPTVDGMKTGYTEAAGYCLIASAKRGEMRLISVILGTKSEKIRAQESQKILEYGFESFKTYSLYQAHQPISTEKIWQGKTNELQLGLENPLYITVPQGQYNQLNATLQIDKHIMAPIVVGETLGTLNIRLGEQVISERPLIALSSIETGNLWKRLIDSFLLLFY